MDKLKNSIARFRPYLASNLFKTVMFLCLAALIVVGNFFVERNFANGSVMPVEGFFSFDYVVDNEVPLNGVIRFDSEEVTSLNNSVLVENLDGGGMIFKVNSGKFWTNLSVSDARVNLLLKNVVLIPDHAVFDIVFDGSRLKMNVFDGDVYLGFLRSGLLISSFQDQYSALLKNKIVVSKGMQVDLYVDKNIDERVLYSKLAKEFKLATVAGDVLGSDWVASNLKKDVLFVESRKNDAYSYINSSGLRVHGGFVGGLVLDLKELFTFVSDKQHQILYDNVFAYLDDSIYFASIGEMGDSDDRFSSFVSRSSKIIGDDDYWERVDGYITFLSVFDVEDPHYQTLLKLLDHKFTNKRGVVDVMGFLARGIYTSVDKDKEFLLSDALDRYLNYFEDSLKSFEKKDFFVEYLAYNNQFFDNLFAKYPIFYRGDYMMKKRDLIEVDLLNLYVADEMKDANDLKNHFIDRKIVFLKRLENFFFDEKITVVEAKDLLTVLFSDVNALMPEGSSNLAVVGLFEKRLSSIANFWGYLNSPEYYASRSYGATQKQRFKVYMDEKPFVATVLSLRDAVLGENNDTKLSVEDVKGSVVEVFGAVTGVTDFSVGEIDDVTQRHVPVKGVIEGYPFEAMYDRDHESVKDVYVYGELVIDRPAKIGGLLAVFKDRFADLDEAKKEQDEKVAGTYAERFARLYVASILNDEGFAASIDNVLVVDKLNAVYRIEKVSVSGAEKVVLTFDLAMNKEMATNLFLTVKGEPLVLKGEYTLKELYDIAVSGGEFSGGVRR